MSGVVPFSLKDAPSFIERAFPAQRVSIEAQAERKAGAGQTLTALGSYWKGRKPLILVRACVLGALLPATEDPEKDLEVFELLMAMDRDAFARHRLKTVSREDVEKYGGPLRAEILDEKGAWKLRGAEKARVLGEVLARMPYLERVDKRSLRPEELPATAYDEIWERVNAQLGTSARSHVELVEQLGIMRFGHRPKVADTFCGGGSIPFEAARLGCDVYASDLSPIACMLTWGALNIIGANESTREEIARAQKQVADEVEAEIARLGIEHDDEGNRAKAFLYCLETRCKSTGWMVPLASTWVISRSKNICARLVPDRIGKRFEIDVIVGASEADMLAAVPGTARDGCMIYLLDGEEHRTPIKTLRGDRRVDGETVNDLRPWEKSDFSPREDDVYQERLYCIQWIRPGARTKRSEETFFRGVTEADLIREGEVERIVRTHLARWHDEGLVPDMAIERGSETARLLRERGWTYWFHLFPARHLLILAALLRTIRAEHGVSDHVRAALLVGLCRTLNLTSRLCMFNCRWKDVGRAPKIDHVFMDQNLNVLANFGVRSFAYLTESSEIATELSAAVYGSSMVDGRPASQFGSAADIVITDPPYADAVTYQEITEYFIAWLRKNPPAPFRDWVWDSRRDLAIKGAGEDFRREMVKAYGAMAEHMPANGLQIVMFTHQDSKVWGDMAGIFWGAGLQVTAAWYIATETTSELKKGGYVQGTVLLVLRKRAGTQKIYKDELVQEIRVEVERQIKSLTGLNQRTRDHGRDENLFEDVDLQMAGFAAALRVLTSYTHIEGQDMTREALRPRVAGERSLTDEVIDHAVAIANEYLVPEGLAASIWEKLSGVERFYLRMLDVEAAGGKKLDNYQNFAKAFKVGAFGPLMASQKPNDARLKSAAELGKSGFEGAFGTSPLRAVLFAIHEIAGDVEPDDALHRLRALVTDYGAPGRRAAIAGMAAFIARKVDGRRSEEASAARVLEALVKNEKVGA